MIQVISESHIQIPLNEISSIVDTARNLIKTAATNPHFEYQTKWFGIGVDVNNLNVLARDLEAYMARCSSLTFVHEPGDDYGAVFSNLFRGAGGLNPIEFVPSGLRIYLGDAYRNGSMRQKILTVVHEITHKVIGTRDFGDAGYGYESCRILANTQPANAFVNADNWAYYLTEYRNLPVFDLAGVANLFD